MKTKLSIQERLAKMPDSEKAKRMFLMKKRQKQMENNQNQNKSESK